MAPTHWRLWKKEFGGFMHDSRKAVPAARNALRKGGIAVGFVAAMLMTASLTAPAQAATADTSPSSAAQKVTGAVKPAANGALAVTVTGGAEVAALAPPTTSPAVRRQLVASGGTYTCASGYACAAVPTSGGAYVFHFYNYGSYSLSNWLGTGHVVNNQTGGAAFRADNVSGGQVHCVPAGILRNGVNWNPIWRIRLTSSGC